MANSAIPKRFFEPCNNEKNVFGSSRGSGGMLPPENFENLTSEIV